MGGRKWLIVNLHKTTDGGVGRWLTSRVVGWGSVDVEPPIQYAYPYSVYPLYTVNDTHTSSVHIHSISDRAEGESAHRLVIIL